MSIRGAPPAKPKLRKREIAFAVGAGLIAASAAGLVLSEISTEHPAIIAGTKTDRTYEIAPFEQISTIGPQDVIISYGEEFGVRAEGSASGLAKLEVSVEDGTLAIRPKDTFSNFDWDRVEPATFYVTLPNLAGVSLLGSGDVKVDKAEGKRFSGMIAGSGKMEVLSLKVDTTDLTVAGSGDFAVAGTAHSAKVTIGGSGEIDAGGLTTEDANVTVGGSGDVELGVTGRAKVAILGSGDVDITGTDKCTVSRLGSGDVSCNGEVIGED